MMIWSLFYAGIILLVGSAVTSVLMRGQRRSISELAALVVLLGAGTTGTLLLSLSLLGLRPSRASILIVGLISVIILFFMQMLGILFVPVLPKLDRRPRSWLLITVPMLVLLFANLSVLIPALGFGLFEWDSFSNWGLKAKVLYHAALTPRPAYFTDIRLSFSHLDYPLLLPILTAGSYAMMGQVDDRLGKIVLPLILAGQTCLSYVAARLWLGRLASLVAAMLLVCAPINLAFSGLGIADAMLATFWLGSVTYLLRWIGSRDRRDIVIAAWFSLFTVLTKSEGLPLATMVLLIVWAISAGLKKYRDAGSFSLIMVLGTAGWIGWRAGLPHSDENYLGHLRWSVLVENVPRLATILPAMGRCLADVSWWGGLWLLVPLMAILGFRAFRLPQAIVLWAILLGHLSLYLLIYVISPWEDLDALLAASLGRLMLHAAPIAMMLVAMHWAEIGQVGSSHDGITFGHGR